MVLTNETIEAARAENECAGSAQLSDEPVDGPEVIDEHFCPINAALTLLNGRWTPHIIHELLLGRTRFNDMARAIGINPRTLRERLKELEDEGVVARRVLTQMPPSVEYTLTEKGRALDRVFETLGEWGIKWVEKPGSK